MRTLKEISEYLSTLPLKEQKNRPYTITDRGREVSPPYRFGVKFPEYEDKFGHNQYVLLSPSRTHAHQSAETFIMNGYKLSSL